MAKGDDIQEQLINFAVEIIKLCSKLPKTRVGNHVARQLLRRGTAGAPNYEKARGVESNRDFVHKLGVAFKELNESNIWLEIIKRSKMLSFKIVQPIANECTELCKIISTSIRTVGKKH